MLDELDKINISKEKGPKNNPQKPFPLVFMEVSVDGKKPTGLIVFKLYEDTPITSENFRCLCTGEKGISKLSGKPLHYKGCTFHRIETHYIL